MLARRKVLLLIVAWVLAFSMCATALAVDVDLSLGNVTIGSEKVTHTKANEGEVTEEHNNEVIVTQSNSEKTTTNTISIGDNVGTEKAPLELVLAGVNIDVQGNKSAINMGENNNVEIVVEGKNNITSTTTDPEDKLDGNTTGIRAGGATGDDEESTNNNVTITTENDGTLNISGTASGILVDSGSSLTIDGNGTADDATGKLKVNIKETEKIEGFTQSGNGIITYGEVTIQDGAEVNISNTGRYGIVADENGGGEKVASVTIQGEGTKVDITNTAASGLYLESYTTDPAQLTITDGAEVTIKGAGKNASGDSPNGVSLDSSNATISDGAKLTIDESGFHGINMDGVKNEGDKIYYNTLDISGEDTEVSILNSNSKKAGMNIANYKNVLVYDGAKLNVDNAGWGALVYRKSKMIVEDATALFSNCPGGGIAFYGGLVELRNNAHVEANKISYLRKYEASIGSKLVVVGGTLTVQDPETNIAKEVWPTNGYAEIYGDEQLTNFILPNDAAHLDFVTFGWSKTENVPDDYSGAVVEIGGSKYIAQTIIENNALGGSYSNNYVSDLTKESGNTLSVWVPAVTLTYYLAPAADGEDVAALYAANSGAFTKQDGEDVIIRGQSVNFATLDEDKAFEALNANAPQGYTIQWYVKIHNEDGTYSFVPFDGNTGIVAENEAEIYGVYVPEDDEEDSDPGDPDDPPATPPTEPIPLGTVAQDGELIPLGVPYTGDVDGTGWTLLAIVSLLLAASLTAWVMLTRKRAHR